MGFDDPLPWLGSSVPLVGSQARWARLSRDFVPVSVFGKRGNLASGAIGFPGTLDLSLCRFSSVNGLGCHNQVEQTLHRCAPHPAEHRDREVETEAKHGGNIERPIGYRPHSLLVFDQVEELARDVR